MLTLANLLIGHNDFLRFLPVQRPKPAYVKSDLSSSLNFLIWSRLLNQLRNLESHMRHLQLWYIVQSHHHLKRKSLEKKV